MQNKIRTALYRPFFTQYLYFDKTRTYNEDVHLIPKFFPEGDSENLVICIPDKGKPEMFSTIITDITPDLHVIEQSQFFPLHTYNNNRLDGGGGVEEQMHRKSHHHHSIQIRRKALRIYHRYYPRPRSHSSRTVLPVLLLQGGSPAARISSTLH